MNQSEINSRRLIGLATITVICLILFLKLAQEVWAKDSVVILDQKIVDLVYTFRTPFLTTIMTFFTSLANATNIIILMFILVVTFAAIKQRKYIVPLLVTVLGSFLFVEIVKTLFARPRPLLANALVVESSYSFPSGHALIAITLYGLLVIYLCRAFKTMRARLIIVISGVAIILLVGLSRIYLGVHWPSDVLASYLIGTCWLCIVYIGIEYKRSFQSFFKILIGRLSHHAK